jgi:hypothetical protein
MMTAVKESLWKQFGGSMDMLKNAIAMWPEQQWFTNKKFFYIAYHSLVFLDYYLTIPPPQNFSSPLPFTETEPEQAPADAVDDVIPDRIYSKKELLDYLEASREKCHNLIAELTERKLQERWIEVAGNKNYSIFELLLYNMRHVQHHAAQLNLLLRQGINDAPRWVRHATDEL